MTKYTLDPMNTTAKQLIAYAQRHGFRIARKKGSHVILKAKGKGSVSIPEKRKKRVGAHIVRDVLSRCHS